MSRTHRTVREGYRWFVLIGLVLCWATASWAQPADDENAAADAPDDRPTISVKIDDEQGGGRAELFAGNFEFQPGEYVIATEGVEIRYRDLEMTADRARFDIPANLLTAEGNVILDEGPRRLTGDTLEYNISTRTGRLQNATAFVDPDYYFSGAEVAKIDADEYTISDGVFTSCSQESPSWSIALSSARITLEEYARMRNARVRLKRLPVLYMPYLLWPAKTERASGFLIPRPGYSDRRGAQLGLAYFKTLGRSADLTFFADAYSKEFFGGGLELRYRPSERTEGTLQMYAITEPDEAFLEDRGLILNPDGTFMQDPDGPGRVRPQFDPTRAPGDTRWKVNYLHETTGIFKYFKGVIAFQDYSDFEYLADYDRTIRRSTQPWIYSNAYLSGNIGPHSLNFQVDQREFLPRLAAENDPNRLDDNVFRRNRRRQLPELEYRLRSTRLGKTPLYLDVLSSASAFQLDGTAAGSTNDEGVVQEMPFSESYERADFRAALSMPLSSLLWLSAKVEVGGRVTHYTRQVLEDQTGFDDGKGALTRTLPFGSLEVVGPSFSRIFDVSLGRFSKLKHVVEPRIDYRYQEIYDDARFVPQFDEVDRVLPSNGLAVSLVNRFVAKPAKEEDGGAFEIASFTLSRGYSFDDDLPGQFERGFFRQDGTIDRTKQSDRYGPIGAELRFNPSERTSLRFSALYNTLFETLQSTRLTGTLGFRRSDDIRLSWITDYVFDIDVPAEQDDKTTDQLSLSTKIELVRDRLFFKGGIRYDIRAADNELLMRPATLAQEFGLSFKGACLSWDLLWRETQLQNVRDTDFRFLLTLKNVGTFIDLNGSTDF